VDVDCDLVCDVVWCDDVDFEVVVDVVVVDGV